MPDKCLVVGCGSRRDRDKVSFYRVPSIVDSVHFPNLTELLRKRRLAWLAAIKREDLTQSKETNQRVCSKHFVTGKPSKLEDVIYNTKQIGTRGLRPIFFKYYQL